MNGIIIYKGKYGATRQYAQWLSENLSFPISRPELLTDADLEKFDCIIIGSSVYIGKLQVKKWLKTHAAALKYKKLFLFIVAGTPPTEKEKLDAIVEKNVPAVLRSGTPVYFLHGRLDMKKLSFTDRMLLKMGARMQKDPAVKNSMLQEYDDVRKEHLLELETGVRSSMTFEKKNVKVYS